MGAREALLFELAVRSNSPLRLVAGTLYGERGRSPLEQDQQIVIERRTHHTHICEWHIHDSRTDASHASLSMTDVTSHDVDSGNEKGRNPSESRPMCPLRSARSRSWLETWTGPPAERLVPLRGAAVDVQAAFSAQERALRRVHDAVARPHGGLGVGLMLVEVDAEHGHSRVCRRFIGEATAAPPSVRRIMCHTSKRRRKHRSRKNVPPPLSRL